MIKDFLKKEYCKICNKELKIYLSSIECALFKLDIESDNCNYTFKHSKYFKNEKLNVGSVLTINFNDNYIDITCNNDFLKKNIEKNSLYLFKICNDEAIEFAYESFQINTFEACSYYHSTFLDYKFENKWNWIENDKNQTNESEVFSFSELKEEAERVYIIDSNFKDKHTTLYFYTLPIDEIERSKINEDEIKIFEKQLPLVESFDFSDKSKLVSKLDNWITVS